MRLEYKLVRSKRKTIALYVQFDGSLLVRAPLRASQNLIDTFVLSKEDWIEKQRRKFVRLLARQQEDAINRPYSIFFLGEEYPVEIVDKLQTQLFFDGEKFYLASENKDDFIRASEAWFRLQARQILEERVAWFVRKYHFEPKKIRITSARTRWGSCSSHGTVSFSWRLIIAPLEVIDYVVVHELVHLGEKNHQKTFWGKVAAILPDYESRRKWLKTNGGNLMNNISAKDYS